MKQLITILMLVGGLFFAYKGITKLDEASASIEIGDLKLSTSDTEGRNTAYVYLGVGAVLLIGGIYNLKRSK